jgi:hypothetical protein
VVGGEWVSLVVQRGLNSLVVSRFRSLISEGVNGSRVGGPFMHMRMLVLVRGIKMVGVNLFAGGF